jgi:hypothetical protein
MKAAGTKPGWGSKKGAAGEVEESLLRSYSAAGEVSATAAAPHLLPVALIMEEEQPS